MNSHSSSSGRPSSGARPIARSLYVAVGLTLGSLLAACGGSDGASEGAVWDFTESQSSDIVGNDFDETQADIYNSTITVVLDTDTSFPITAERISPTIGTTEDEVLLRGITFSNPGSTEEEAVVQLAEWADAVGFTYDSNAAEAYFAKPTSVRGRGFTVGSTDNTGFMEALALEPAHVMPATESSFEYYLLVDDRRENGAGLTPTLTIWWPLNS